MYKKLVFLIAVLGIWLSPVARAETIVWIAEALNNASGVPYDQGWIDLLTAKGYTVDVQRGSWMTLSTAQIATLNSADLVIFSRTTNSGNYATDATEVTQWNSVTTPMISLGAYQIRNSRWLWVNSATIIELASAPESPLKVVKANHPIFSGVSVVDGQVDVIDESVDLGQMSFIVATDPGNGTILGTRASDGNIWIEEWAPGTPFYSGSTQTPAGKRMLLTAGGGSGQTMGSMCFNPAGQKLFLNAVLYMMGKALDASIASSPSPANEATDLPRDTNLSWMPGENAATHDVYFGTVFNDVNNATRGNPLGVLVSKGQDANTYDPGLLSLGQTYYWRIDEVDQSGTIHKGTTWNFAIEPVTYAVTGVTATASSFDAGRGPELTINGSGITGDLHGTDVATMWLSAKKGPQPTWIQYDLGRVCKLTDMWVWNYNIEFEFILGMGVKGTTIEYSTDATNWTTLGTFEFAQGASAADYEHGTTVSFGGVAAQYVKITVNSGWSTTGQYGLSEVRFFELPVAAREPSPADTSTAITPDITLSWRAGREAASHNVYIGTDANAVKNGTVSANTVATNSFSATGLALNTMYYWKVDEVNAAQAITTWPGKVWSFKTNPFIPVDDMESYNDTTNRMFDVWVDGYGTTTNGSQVGYGTATANTFGETAIIYDGKQSMPLTYNNTGGITNSEATRAFDAAQNWTTSGVKTLTLFFRGQEGNTTTIPFWVKVADQSGKSATVTFGSAAGEDVAVLADAAWTTWNIPVAKFSGVNFAKVKSMTIGLGTGSGSGKLYIDAIRLYPEVTTTVTTPTLVGWWKLDNDVKDGSGNGNNGAITGAPTYLAAGKIGAALTLNGTADYVDCGAAASLNITDKVTLSAWVKPANFANSAYQNVVSKGDHAYCLQQSSANQIEFHVYDGAWYSALSTAVTTAVNGTWHHVAGTFDGDQLRLYWDGVLAGSKLHTGDIDTTTYTVSIGRNSEQSGRLFNGTIDDVRIYRGVLPTSEVKKLANP